MGKPFSIIAILLLIVVAALQIVLLVGSTHLVINGMELPPWAILAILAVAVILIIGLFAELFSPRGEDDDEDGATRSRGSRGITRSKPAPVWQKDGRRLPADYFMFASRGVSVKSIKAAADKYDRIMVGFDSGGIPTASLRAAQDAGAELEIYVEGPGGPTGNSWSADERARVKRAAAKVGVHTGESDWMEQWDKWAWKAYAFQQLEDFMGEGYSAAEIDNLGRVLGERSEPLIAFFKEYGERCLAGHLPRLIMKNISPAQLDAVVKEVKSGALPRAMFSEFHIAEKGAGYSRTKQDELSKLIAIRTVPSNDTYNYDAYGEYGLGKEFAAMMPPVPVTPAPAAPASTPASPPPVSPPPPSPQGTAPATPSATPAAPPVVAVAPSGAGQPAATAAAVPAAISPIAPSASAPSAPTAPVAPSPPAPSSAAAAPAQVAGSAGVKPVGPT